MRRVQQRGVDASPEWAAPAALIGLLGASAIVTVGTLWAFERGAPDFKVFYAAWSLVLQGRGAEIYSTSPDRYLYAPGFAWLLAPLAWLPLEAALALWCFAKAAVVGYVVREFQPGRRWGLASIGLSAWGVALLARPLLIDFQYGQINTLILGVCCWALLGRFRRGEGSLGDFARWCVLAIAALAKIFPLPLLVVPWLSGASVPRSRLRMERAGLVTGLGLVLAAPLLSLDLSGTWVLLHAWKEALIARGLPFESHNQSFSALLHRWFSGAPVHVVALGMEPVKMGWGLLSEQAIRLLSLAWIFGSAGALLAWLMRAERTAPLRWVAVAVALLILPSHLVWKPYFVMFLPVGAMAAGALTRSSRCAWLLGLAFVAMNFTGFDFLGGAWGARMEGASVMLWAALAYLGFVERTGDLA